jgi:urease accessory protein
MILAGRKHHHVEERFGFGLLPMAVAVRRPMAGSCFRKSSLSAGKTG